MAASRLPRLTPHSLLPTLLRPALVLPFPHAMAARCSGGRTARVRPDRPALDLFPGGRGAGDDARLLVACQGAAEAPDAARLPAADRQGGARLDHRDGAGVGPLSLGGVDADL